MAGAGTFAASYVAGALTTLSPCVLPLLPVLIMSALQQHAMAPLALAAGLSVSFVGVGIAVASAGAVSGMDPESLRTIVSTALLGFGLVLVVPSLQAGVAQAVAPIAGRGGRLLEKISPVGVASQFLLGALLGVVWTPCTGPTLGVAVGLAAQSGTMALAAAIMALFSAGAATPVLALAYGSRRAIASRKATLAAMSQTAKSIMGAVLVTVGVLALTGMDRVIEAHLTDLMPA
ncbi:MAG: cytochrome c biogenesis CcdA family protein, partial [Alphaproteobacteria bacterium]|nr:cytochrome c biogenesis CcdA family protein [Alphaproteobacteria bacterium]